MIGFLQEQFALYLIFPKSLPASSDARVIGIKYNLLAEPVETERTPKATATTVEKKQKIAPPRVAADKPPPPKQFRVRILRQGTSETTLTVSAENISQAGEKALQTVRTKSFKPDQVREEVKEISQIGSRT